MLLNFWRTSEMPSLYQIGVILYMGGHTKIFRSGREAAKVMIFSKNPEMRGSTRVPTDEDVEDEAIDPVMKLVTHETMQPSDSARVSANEAARVDSLPHGMN